MVDLGRFSDKFNFKYKTEYVKDPETGRCVPVHKPRIQVVFRRFSETKDQENREFPTFALVDSGADFSFLPLKIAKILRLDIDQTGEKILTIVGEARVFKSKVYVEIPIRGKRPISIGYVDVRIMESEVDEKYIQQLIVLGRKDFFERFEITFNESGKYITFKDIHKDRIQIRK